MLAGVGMRDMVLTPGVEGLVGPVHSGEENLDIPALED
jgi:hypothetical protein